MFVKNFKEKKKRGDIKNLFLYLYLPFPEHVLAA